jgi:hypothetical protein
MIGDLQRARMSRGCQTLFQLQWMVKLVPSREIKTRLEMRGRLDRAGLDVTGEPWAISTAGKLLISEAVWPTLRSIVIDRARQGTQSQVSTSGGKPGNGWSVVCYRAWLRKRYVVELEDVPCQSLTEAECNAQPTALRDSPDLERVLRDRIGMPGPRQLTMLEAIGGVRAAKAAFAPGRLEKPGGGEAPRELRVADSTWPRQRPYSVNLGSLKL